MIFCLTVPPSLPKTSRLRLETTSSSFFIISPPVHAIDVHHVQGLVPLVRALFKTQSVFSQRN